MSIRPKWVNKYSQGDDDDDDDDNFGHKGGREIDPKFPKMP
jgi:hypothetical protein